MKALRWCDDGLGRLEGVLLVALLSVMVVLSFTQVILRNVFSESLLWGEILLRHLVLWIGFLGAARATGEGRHISIDAFARFLPPRTRTFVRLLTNCFAVFICAFLLRASLTFISDEIEFGSTVFTDVPSWYSQIVIPAGFGLMIFHFTVRIITGISRLRTGVIEE
jgi:C4-dicarboxylate transporter DctQ subunit